MNRGAVAGVTADVRSGSCSTPRIRTACRFRSASLRKRI